MVLVSFLLARTFIPRLTKLSHPCISVCWWYIHHFRTSTHDGCLCHLKCVSPSQPFLKVATWAQDSLCPRKDLPDPCRPNRTARISSPSMCRLVTGLDEEIVVVLLYSRCMHNYARITIDAPWCICSLNVKCYLRCLMLCARWNKLAPAALTPLIDDAFGDGDDNVMELLRFYCTMATYEVGSSTSGLVFCCSLKDHGLHDASVSERGAWHSQIRKICMLMHLRLIITRSSVELLWAFQVTDPAIVDAGRGWICLVSLMVRITALKTRANKAT